MILGVVRPYTPRREVALNITNNMATVFTLNYEPPIDLVCHGPPIVRLHFDLNIMSLQILVRMRFNNVRFLQEAFNI